MFFDILLLLTTISIHSKKLYVAHTPFNVKFKLHLNIQIGLT